jgi:peptide/nickel transport system permease protein
MRPLLRRVLYSVPTIFGVIVLSFLLLRMIPGDPVDILLGEQASATDREAMRHRLGLDVAPLTQFRHYVSGLAHLDLGPSLHGRGPVTGLIFEAFPSTLALSLAALGLALLWGVPAGVWAAVRQNRFTDRLAMTAALIGMSTPAVFLGPLLIYVFAMRLGWLPVSEGGGWRHLILPALSLALPLGASLLRMTRAAVLETLHQDYIRTAVAKGLSPGPVYFKHALFNALMPVITIAGLQLGALLTGTVVTETIFDRPGLGALLYGAIQRRDYPLVQGAVLLIAVTYVLVNLLTDLTYTLVNPRMRRGADE